MVLNWGLNNRWAIVTCGFLAVAWAVIMSGKIGSNFMPQGDVGQIQVKYELPPRQQRSSNDRLFENHHRFDRGRAAKGNRQWGLPKCAILFPPLARQRDWQVDWKMIPQSALNLEPLWFNSFHLWIDFDTKPRWMEDLRHEIDNRLDSAPGLTYKLERVEEGPPGGFDVAIRLEAGRSQRTWSSWCQASGGTQAYRTYV